MTDPALAFGGQTSMLGAHSPPDVTIFHSFLQWFHRSGDARPAGAARTPDTDRRITAVLIIINLLTLMLLASVGCTDMRELAYKCVWMFLAYLGFALMYRLAAGKRYSSNKTNLVTTIAVGVHLLIIVLLQRYAVHLHPGVAQMMLLLVPYMLAPVFVSVLLGRHMGGFVTVCVTLYGALLLPEEDALPYMAVSLVTGLASVILTVSLRKREQILTSGFITGILVFVCVVLLEFLKHPHSSYILEHPGAAAACAFGMSFFIAIFIGGILPFVERIFNLCTPITWLELGDMNHPLLKKLQLNAPGTFHHSIVVSRLAEAAAEAVGADVTQCGVASLYHDIGKIAYPQYFAENIPDFATSPHQELTPDMSAQLIIGHVAEGVEMAKKYHLNSRILDVIREHHGVTTAYYFYRQAIDRYDEAVKQFEAGQTDTKPDPVNEALFRYKGPIPQSRESGIVSLADAVESATRSLKEPTPAEVEEMIDNVIRGRILDQHLQDSGLTFGDVRNIRDAFIATLKTMAHNRIAYPRRPLDLPPGTAPKDPDDSGVTPPLLTEEAHPEHAAEKAKS